MQSQLLYNNNILSAQNTDPQIKNTVPYDYKKKRDELNKLVKNHIAKQQNKLTQKNKSIAR